MRERLVVFVLLLICGIAVAEEPSPLERVGIDQKPGAQVPPDIVLRDEAGAAVRAADLWGRGRPVVLALVYYRCPALCNIVLNDLEAGLRPLSFTAGEDFEVVCASIDPRETPALAAAKKRAYVERYGRAAAERGFSFLTGEEAQVRRLADAIGFRYAYDAERDQFAHAAALVLLTPEGRIARYLLGVGYAPRDLKLGIVEASEGRIGSVADRLLLLCYPYDPATGKYGAVIGAVRAGGALTVIALAAFIAVMIRRERARARAAAGREGEACRS